MSPDRRRRVLYGITTGISADKLLRGQLRWIRERGWDVSLAVSPGPETAAVAAREGVQVAELPMAREISLGSDLQSIRDWMGLIRRLRPDVVNASTPKAGLLGMVSAAVLRVPRRVYVMRGLRLEGARGLLRAVLWVTERLTTAAATDVVVVSASLGEVARRAGLLHGRRAWLVGEGSSNGVRADDVMAEAQRGHEEGLRRQLGFGDDDVVVGYVGRIARDKGVDTLVSALDGLEPRGVRGLFVGSLDGDASLKLGPRDVHVEWTDDVWRHYAAMDILCLPTRREGFPNVVLEAASAGVPCVTTRATGAVDSVTDGVTGVLFEVGDVGALRRELFDLAADRTRRETMGAAARRRVLEVFSPEAVWSGIESIMAGRPAHHVTQL